MCKPPHLSTPMLRTAPGFTLIELMVTIGIVAILAAIAFPSFESSLRSNRVATATNELTASLALARSEALRNPGGAILCASTNAATCGGTWNDGWIVAVDLNDNDVADANDRIVRSTVPNTRLAVTATASSGNSAVIVFDRRGRMADASTRTLSVVPGDCPSGQALQRVLTLRATGQVSASKVACT